MTNLEYIRSMSAEELAEFIVSCVDACYNKGYFGEDRPNCPLYGCGTPKYGSGCCSDIGIVEWLKEERRTDEEDTDSVRENL